MSAKFYADPKLQEKTRQLIANGNTQDALLLLFENGFDQAIGLKNQLDEAFRHFEAKRIDFTSWATLENQVNFEVLAILNPEKPSKIPIITRSSKPVDKPFQPGPIAKQAVLALLDQNKISDALNLCGNLGNEQIMLKARYHAGQKYVLLGLVSDHTWAILENQIRFILQELIKNAPDLTPKIKTESVFDNHHIPDPPRLAKNILDRIKGFLRI